MLIKMLAKEEDVFIQTLLLLTNLDIKTIVSVENFCYSTFFWI